MTRYDPELLAALVAGDLSPDEAAALQRRIADDPEATAELGAQRLARQALRDAPGPMLSAEERTQLRRAVADALHVEAPAVADARPRLRRWRPLALAAAALAALAISVPLVTLLSMRGDDTALTTLAQADLTARSLEETVPASEAADAESGAALLGAEEQDASQAYLADLLADPAGLIASADPALTACSAEARALLGGEASAAPVAPTPEDGDLVAWLVSPDGITVSRLAVFRVDGCRLVASHP